MGVSAQELSTRYPVLYHMASYNSWPSILEHGLLSSSALIKMFEVRTDEAERLLRSQRKTGTVLKHQLHKDVTLRDQKPLSTSALQRCLVDCETADWYQLLNERVFFWLNRDRLQTLMSAKEYTGQPHVVLFIDSAALVDAYKDRIEIAHMNTGNTRPFAHPRSRETFKTLSEYPYEQRRKKPDYSAIVELTVLQGVPDIARYVTLVEHATMLNGTYQTIETLLEA